MHAAGRGDEMRGRSLARSLAGADLVLLVEHTMDVYKQRPLLLPLLRIAFGDLLAWRSRVHPSVGLPLHMASRPLELSGMVIQCVFVVYLSVSLSVCRTGLSAS